MRTIKFRGKSIGTGEWLFGNLFKFGIQPPANIPCICVCVPTWKDALDIYTVHDNTIGQFTGLLDRNGKEIYEGDIVLWIRKKVHIEGRPLQDFSDVCKIYYDEKKCAFYFRYEMDCGACCGVLDFNDDRAEISYIEVIGNIYDNPELLKGGSR